MIAETHLPWRNQCFGRQDDHGVLGLHWPTGGIPAKQQSVTRPVRFRSAKQLGHGQDTINDAGQQIVRRQLNIAPTLTIRPGFPVRVIVTRDLVLESYGGS